MTFGTFTPSEKEVESACDELVAMLGGGAIRLSQARATNQTPGIPDRRYTLYGETFWWEVKTSSGHYYVDQYEFAANEIRTRGLVGVGGLQALREFAIALRGSRTRARLVGEQQVLERRSLGLKRRQPKKKKSRPMAATRGDYERLVREHPERFPTAARSLGIGDLRAEDPGGFASTHDLPDP